MAAVIAGVTKGLRLPFGVDVLWDPVAAIALAAATGASFVREVFTGAYPSDMGLWDTACGEALRYRRALGAGHIKLLFNIQAEFAGRFDTRPLGALARSVAFSSLADALCVSGPMTGQAVSLDDLRVVKAAVGDLPVVANTGVRPGNVAEILAVADAAVVGTALKADGVTWNPVDPERVKSFMRAARGQT
jgi:membrane complex biogenesis BtpA family protein